MKHFLFAFTLLAASLSAFAQEMSYYHGPAIGIGTQRKGTFMVLTKVTHQASGAAYEVNHYSVNTKEGKKLILNLKKTATGWILHSDAAVNPDSDFSVTMKGSPEKPESVVARAPNPKNPKLATVMKMNMTPDKLETELATVDEKGTVSGKVTTHQPAVTKAEYEKIIATLKFK